MYAATTIDLCVESIWLQNLYVGGGGRLGCELRYRQNLFVVLLAPWTTLQNIVVALHIDFINRFILDGFNNFPLAFETPEERNKGRKRETSDN
jgi:hypothetical protein